MGPAGRPGDAMAPEGRSLSVRLIHAPGRFSRVEAFGTKRGQNPDLEVLGRAFLERNCPGVLDLVLRSGSPVNQALEVSEDRDVDLIVVAFAGDLDVGQGAVVRERLACVTVPVLVLPILRERVIPH